MPRTNTERIDELERKVATLIERVDNIRGEFAGLLELKTKVAVIEERLNELKRIVEESGRKWWLVVVAVISGLVGAGLMNLIVQLFLRYLPAG